MDKNNFKTSLSSTDIGSTIVSDKYDKKLAVDQSFSIKSNIDPRTGYPFTDIQIVMRAKSLSERNRLMDDLQVVKPDYLEDNVTDEQALDELTDRSVQLPSELLDEAKKNVTSKVFKHNKKVELDENKQLYEDFVKRTTPKSETKND